MKALYLFSLAIIVVGLSGCKNTAAQQQAKRTEALVNDQTVPVTVAYALKADLDENLEVTGAFATSEQSSIGSTIGGRLVAVYVKDGDAVRAGQVIAQQDTTDLLSRLRQAQAQADSARSALQQAQTEARVAPTKSKSNVKAAESRLAQAQARFEKAKNGSRSEERTQAEWNVKKAKSDMDTAKAALDRANRLFAEGAIAKVDVENADNRYQTAMSAYQGALENLSMVQSATRPEDLEAARQDVAAAREAVTAAKSDQRLDINYVQRVESARSNLASSQEQVRLAQKALSDAAIRSPFNGRVSGKPAQAGTFAAPGSVIATIIGGAGTYFEANVPESKVALIQQGSVVNLSVESAKGAKLTGRVIAVNPQASGQGRLFTVRVGVDQGLGTVRPGMFAKGQIKLGERNNVVVVPSEAVIRDGENTYLFIVVNGQAKRITTRLGIQSGANIEVSGIVAGDSVVVSGQTGLVDGAKVKAQDKKKGA